MSAVVGVPPITPVDVLSDRPTGSPPDESPHTSGFLPPAVFTVAVYAAPTVPSGTVTVVIESAAYIVIESAFVAVPPFASVTCTVNELAPEPAGIPLIAPVLLSKESPDGREPLMTLHA